jgi:hypothetical protein
MMTGVAPALFDKVAWYHGRKTNFVQLVGISQVDNIGFLITVVTVMQNARKRVVFLMSIFPALFSTSHGANWLGPLDV